jgi:magnesium transporter
MGGVVRCAAYASGRRVGDLEIKDVGEVLRQRDQFVWIGLHEPDESLLHQVQDEFGLHDLAIEDAHRAHQRPKVELYGESLFAVFRTAHYRREEDAIEFGETHVFVGARYVVSVRHGASMPYTEVRARCEATPALLAKGPGFVLYALMDFIVDQYFPVVQALEDALDRLEDDIFGGQPLRRDTTARIYQLKRDLVEVKRAVSPLVDICNRLLRFDLPLIAEDTRLYFRDVYDHVIRINEMVDALRELLTTALEANLSLMSAAQNEATKRISAWAAMIGAPTLIASIYGMNFELMPELRWPFGYPLVMLLMVGLCGFLFYKFKRSGWL